MLSKADRLSIEEFDLVIKTGFEVYSPFFTVKYTPADRFKFSPSAPKKTFKTAVSRNKIRRRIYGAVRKIISSKKTNPSLVVLVVKKNIAGIDSQCLVSMIKDLFVQARLIA